MSGIISNWHRQQEDRKYKALFVSFVEEEYLKPIQGHDFGVSWRFSMAFGQAAYRFATCCFGCFPSDVSRYCELCPGALTPCLTVEDVRPLLNWYTGNAGLPKKFMTDKLAREVDYFLTKHCPDVYWQKKVEKFATAELERFMSPPTEEFSCNEVNI